MVMLSVVMMILLPLDQDAKLRNELPRVGFSVWGGNTIQTIR